MSIEMQDALNADKLAYLGWKQTGITARGNERITWWRKAGHQFPQHFALWLELSGAVRLIAEVETGIESFAGTDTSQKSRKYSNATASP